MNADEVDRVGKWVTAVVSILCILALAVAIGYRCGQANVRSSLLKDGFKVTVDYSVSPGDGRYMVEIWEGPIGWTAVGR